MAPCGLPVLTGRERLFTAGQDTQLSGRRVPFSELVPTPPAPSPSLSGSHSFFYPPLSSWPSSQLSPATVSLSEWTRPRSLSRHYLIVLVLLISICFSFPSIVCRTFPQILFLLSVPSRNSPCKKFPVARLRTIITFPKRHFSCFFSFNSFISQITSPSALIPATVTSSPLSLCVLSSFLSVIIPAPLLASHTSYFLLSSLCHLVPSSLPSPLLPVITSPSFPYISAFCPLLSVSTYVASYDGITIWWMYRIYFFFSEALWRQLN